MSARKRYAEPLNSYLRNERLNITIRERSKSGSDRSPAGAIIYGKNDTKFAL